MSLEQSPLYPVFLLVAAEYERSLKEHKPWSESKLSAEAMHKVAFAELAEVDLARAMGDEEEIITEFVHVANVACKSIAELTRRKITEGRMCEQVCKGQGERVTNLRASEKELRDELRKVEAERDRYKAALERIAGYDFSAFAGILGPVGLAKEALAEPPC